MPHLSVSTYKTFSNSRISRKTGPPTRGAKKCPTKKQERQRAKRISKRDMVTAMKSLEEYESHAPFETTDKVKDATRSMMNIVEAVSEKGKMTDNQYLEMMNHLLTIHKSEDAPTIRRRLHMPAAHDINVYEDIVRNALLYNDLTQIDLTHQHAVASQRDIIRQQIDLAQISNVNL